MIFSIYYIGEILKQKLKLKQTNKQKISSINITHQRDDLVCATTVCWL